MRNGERGGIAHPADRVPESIHDTEPIDRELLARFVRGDESVFAALIKRHGPMVLGVCRRVLNHQEDAEDAFQATFLVLVRKAASIARPELLGNWLYGVAFRTAQKARARLARQRHHEKRVDPMLPVEDPQHDMHWQELRTILDQEMQKLPPKYRAPLVLCYLEGMTNEQAARRLGWPAGSMSYRLARGRQMLRDRLKSRKQAMPTVILGALLSRHAAPGQVPPRLAEATFQAAIEASHRIKRRPSPPAPPIAAATSGSDSSDGSSGSSRHPRRWRFTLAILAIFLAAAGATAAYPTMVNWIKPPTANDSSLSPPDGTPGDSSPPMRSCH